MGLTIKIIENVLHLVPDEATGVWTLQYSADGGTTWTTLWQLDYVNNLLKALEKVADNVKQLFGTDGDYSLYYDSTADAWIVRDEVNAVDVLTVKRSGDVAVGRDVSIGRNASVTGTTSLGGSVVTDVVIEKGTPKLTFKGTETGARVFSLREDTGKIVLRDETGAVDIVRFDVATGNVELVGDFLQDLTIKKATPSLVLAGTETGAVTVTIKEDSGDFVVDQDVKVNKATPGVRLTGTETGAGDLTIKENAGKVQVYDNTAAAVKVDDLINRTQMRDSDTVAATIGTGGAAGEVFTTILSLGTGKTHLFPKAAVLTIGGTPGTGEAVTINLYAVNDAGTRILIGSLSLTGTTGSTTLNEGDITTNLITNGAAADIEGHRIVRIDAGAYTSNTASTTATASARAIAEET